ncbi:MAG: gluconate 2-dehydrogenase subunit 3 family protein, partial [Alphaproteobacteria bacterium]
MHDIERRALIKGAAMGALAFTVGGGEVLLTPRAARSQGVPLRTLTVAQAATLDALGETLVPGARQAGISQFVDQQISIPAE